MRRVGWKVGSAPRMRNWSWIASKLQQMIKYMQPVNYGESELAFDTIAEVGQGGHFFGTQHTQDRYETAFYSPFLSDCVEF